MTESSLSFAVNRDRCNRCALCVRDCPVRALEADTQGFPQVIAGRESACLSCQHCMAVCPDGAVSIQGFHPENSVAISPEALPSFESMDLLVRARRSVRQYRRDNVDPALIQRLLTTLSYSPTGANARQLTFTAITDREALATLRTKVLDAIATASAAGHLAGNGQFLSNAIEPWIQHGRDLIFRGAPHLLIVSAPAATVSPQQDVHTALATFDLLAQTAGLGTLWCGYLKMALEAIPSLKALVNLASGQVFYPMLFGYPSITYPRATQREGSAQIQLLASIPNN